MMSEPTRVVSEPKRGNYRRGNGEGFPTNWKEALVTLLSTRGRIFKYEMGRVAEAGIRKIVFSVVAVVAMFFAWLFLMIGAIGLLTLVPELVWWHGALIVGGLHLLVALILFLLVKNGSMPGFPLTRAEFEKDREWLNQEKAKTSSVS